MGSLTVLRGYCQDCHWNSQQLWFRVQSCHPCQPAVQENQHYSKNSEFYPQTFIHVIQWMQHKLLN